MNLLDNFGVIYYDATDSTGEVLSKQFKDNYPQTTCKITPKGIEALEGYVQALQAYLKV